MRLPDFICAGAPKAGSTTLHEYLAQHPDIYLPPGKELHFFDLDENYARGVEWYAGHFSAARERIAGEVTPGYLAYPYVPGRMASVLTSEVKLVFVLRNPVDRAYSEYLHNSRRGLIPPAPFEEAMLWEQRDACLSLVARRHYSFLSRGHYFTHLSNYRRYFASDRMRVLILEEDLGDRKEEALQSLLAFLGAAPRTLETDVWRNSGYLPRSVEVEKLLHEPSRLRSVARRMVPTAGLRRRLRKLVQTANARTAEPPQLSPEVRRHVLLNCFGADIEQLERLLGRDLSIWFRAVGAERPAPTAQGKC